MTNKAKIVESSEELTVGQIEAYYSEIKKAFPSITIVKEEKGIGELIKEAGIN